jgi:hypothetical protein
MIVTNYTPEDLKKLPLRAIVALAARCARRIEHQSRLYDDHPEKKRSQVATANAVRLAEDFANGLPCPSAESTLKEMEDCRAASKSDFLQDCALATFVLAARSAANALHALELSGETAASHSVGSPKPDPMDQLARVTADLAARAAFTAAFEGVAAERHSDSYIKAAIEDYEKLLRLDLGRYPEAGKAIDPSSRGPLGPVGLEELRT